MKINLDKLKSNLGKKEDPSDYSIGLFKAIEAAHNECHSNQVDWTSFTLRDAEKALEQAIWYEAEDDPDDMIGKPNKNNAIHQYLHTAETMYYIKNSKPLNIIPSDVQFF